MNQAEHNHIEGAAGAARALAPDDWRRFLAEQRWYAGKSAQARDVRVDYAIPLPWGDGCYAIAVVDVRFDDRSERYQVPVGRRATLPRDLPARATIGTAPGDGAPLYDAVHDADFRAGLAGALTSGVAARGDQGASWSVAPVPGAPSLGAFDRSTVAAGEQSNTSIIFGDAAILKLFRTLRRGIQPDVEVTEFLTARANFANTPRLVAVVTLDENGSDPGTTAGMAQAYLPGSIDAWSYVLARGQPQFAAPAELELPNEFSSDARRLGAITRAMHEALADASDEDPDALAFLPDGATSEDADRWGEHARRSVRHALGLLQAALDAGTVPGANAAEAQALVRRRDHYLGWIDELVDELGDDLGMLTRVHGDYHLGQVLRTESNDFMVIDFEGEPARSLEERREKTSPLRDVAGMLRSFAYAAATLATTAGAALDPRTRELRSARWERDVRNAYLAGYLDATENHEPSIVPEREAHVRQLVTLFETEKAFYELAYELNNRPSWAWIPMRGIARLFVRGRV